MDTKRIQTLPARGTIVRAIIDDLAAAGPEGRTFKDLLWVYWETQSHQPGVEYHGLGSYVGKSRYRRNGMNLTRILRRWGKKHGRVGTQAPWVLKGRMAMVISE